MMPNSRIFRKEWLRVLPAMVAAAVFFTWPLVLHFFSAIPRGSEPGYVAYFQYFCSLWTKACLTDPAAYWHAPFFFPYRGVFAWCEPQPFTYGLMALIAFAGHAASYNSVVILYMALNGAAVYAVARLLTADRVAAAWSGIWMCSGAYALQQICAPAMLAVCFAFFFIYFLFRLSYGFKQVYFYGSVVCFILVWFTAKQTAFMLVLLSPLYIAPLAAGIRDRRRAAAWGALFIAVTAAFVLPYVYAQWSCVRPMGFSRTLAEVRGVARWGDFVTPAAGHWFFSKLSGWRGYSWDMGIAMLAAVAGALIAAPRDYARRLAARPRIVSGIIFTGAAAFLFSLGPGTVIYRFLFVSIPGIDYIRAPGRAAVFAIFAVAVLAAPAFACIRGAFKSVVGRFVATAAMFVLLFAEMWTMPIGIVYPGSEVSGHSRVVQFLKDSADRLPVIELPLRANSAEMETGSMLRALEHGHPLISGYASFWPQTYMQLKRVSYGADKAKAGRYLDAYGAGYVVLHSHLLSSDEYEAFAAEIGGEIVFEDNGHTVLRRDIIPGTPVDVFPRKVMFGAHMPEVGNIYRIRLDRPIAREFMAVYPGGLKSIMSYSDALGADREDLLLVRGNIILDRGADRFFLRLERLPRNGSAAVGVFEAGED